jgi:hypothetical protein
MTSELISGIHQLHTYMWYTTDPATWIDLLDMPVVYNVFLTSGLFNFIRQLQMSLDCIIYTTDLCHLYLPTVHCNMQLLLVILPLDLSQGTHPRVDHPCCCTNYVIITSSREPLYGIIRRTIPLGRQYKFPLHCLLHPSLSQGNYAPKRHVSSLWIFCTATTSAVLDDNPVSPGFNHVQTQSFLLSRNDKKNEQ